MEAFGSDGQAFGGKGKDQEWYLLYKVAHLAKAMEATFLKDISSLLLILRVWVFFHSFPGKSLKGLKVLSILKQTQGSKWLRLKEFVTTGLI